MNETKTKGQRRTNIRTTQQRHNLEQSGLHVPKLAESQSWPQFEDNGKISQIIDQLLCIPDTPRATDIEDVPAGRIKTTTYRILRDTKQARSVKKMHNYSCQICGHTIELPNGERYAEAHHIQPLGDPHKGADVISNILCVCPNHHAELDYRISVLNVSNLKTVPGHEVDQKYVDYHNRVRVDNPYR